MSDSELPAGSSQEQLGGMPVGNMLVIFSWLANVLQEDGCCGKYFVSHQLALKSAGTHNRCSNPIQSILIIMRSQNIYNRFV